MSFRGYRADQVRERALVHVARRRTSHTVAAMRDGESVSSRLPSINWNDQNRLAA